MNNKTISLSSASTSFIQHWPSVAINDLTNLTISLSGVSEILLPSFLEISWGDGVTNFHENNILQTVNIANGVFSSILNDVFSHVYTPLSSTTTKSLTASVRVNYINNDNGVFNIPLTLQNYDYSTTVGDVQLINTSVSENGDKIHQLVTEKDGYLIELSTK